MKKFAVGADIGGSHISCAIVDLENRKILTESLVTQKVNNQAPADEIFKTWAIALGETAAHVDVTQLAGIGLAMPGPFQYDLGVAMFPAEVAKYQNLFGKNVSDRLKSLLQLNSDSELRYLNDAIAFGVGEGWIGKAAGAKRSVSITLGTGFGSGFLDGGIPVVERGDVPQKGSVWHLPFGGGIADDWFSTRWFVKRYAEYSGNRLGGVKEISDRVGIDGAAEGTFREFGRNLGWFLGPLLKRFDADVLVIGGNISIAYRHFGPELEGSFAAQQVQTSVRVSDLMETASLLGSARLFEEEFWGKVRPLLSRM